MDLQGHLSKMKAEYADPIRYRLLVGQQSADLNALIGETLSIVFEGEIHCRHCGRATRKSYNQGYCFPCSQRLARCDMCIVRPERCHYHLGTCREPDWGEANCMRPHIVYLANSSGLKVGITRETQIPTRWIDQGATQALPIMRVNSRLQSGLVETALASHVSDKTDWRRMLKGTPRPLDLTVERDRLLEQCAAELSCMASRFGPGSISRIHGAEVRQFFYPVERFPDKVAALNLDKARSLQGRLLGAKGQYLIMDTGVLNVRKFGGYCVRISSKF